MNHFYISVMLNVRWVEVLAWLLLVSRIAAECDTLSACQIDQQESARECIRELLRQGHTEKISEIIASICEGFKPLAVASLQQQMLRLKHMQGEIVLGESELQPVIKWGQNNSHVFINIKTSHRWDSPPCLSTKHQTAFLNESLLEYVNVCVVSQQKITFALRIYLYKLANINGEVGERGSLVGFGVSKNGVGMYSAVFQKLQYQIWPFLNKQESNYALWSDIIERYPDDHRKYEETTRAIMKERRKAATKNEAKLLLCAGLALLLFI